MSKLKAVLISHLHGDHFFGLPGLISSMHLMGRKEKLQIIGPEGLKEILELIFKFSETSLRFPLDIIELNAGFTGPVYTGSSFVIESFPLNHRITCFGFKFSENAKMRNLKQDMIDYYAVPVEDRKKIKAGSDFISPEGKRIPNEMLCHPPSASVSYAFCSDTAPDSNYIQYIEGVDALYHEATFENDLELRAADTFHSTAAQAAEQARIARVKRLYLGHFSSRYRETEIILSQAKSIFPETETVKDGYSFTVE